MSLRRCPCRFPSVEKHVQTLEPEELRIERLDEILLCAGIHSLSKLGDVDGVGHDDDRDRGETLAHLLEHSQSPKDRHMQFHEQSVKGSCFMVAGDPREARDAIARRRHFKAEGAEPVAENSAKIVIMIDYQDASPQRRPPH